VLDELHLPTFDLLNLAVENLLFWVTVQVYLKDRAKHDQTARDWVAKYAS